MTTTQWNAFVEFRTQFKKNCTLWSEQSANLYPLQRNASLKDTPEYPLENAIVYNKALDELTKDDDIHLIVIGDNPGKEEQLSRNCKYLVGQSGRIAEGFFRRNPELHTDFRKNVIILNKTPVHTAKTLHLRYLLQNGSSEIKTLILQSQEWMARATAKLHQQLIAGCNVDSFVPEVWLVGYSELKGKGLFLPYCDCLKKSYVDESDWNSVFVYQHFSMNRFLIDLSQFRKENPTLTLEQSLKQLGSQHRNEIFVI